MGGVYGWLKHLRLRLLRKELLISGQCRQCGSCCRRIQIQQGRRWLRSRLEFRRLVRQHPEYARFRIIERDKHGLLVFECTWLRPDNTCANHAQRLDICRNFPAKGIFYAGGELPRGCGYQVHEVIPFAQVLKQEMEKSHD